MLFSFLGMDAMVASYLFKKMYSYLFILLILKFNDRGGDGELRLGIRRAAQVKSGAKVAVAYNEHMNDIASVVNAVSMKSVFNLCYNPRYIFKMFTNTVWFS